MLFSNEQKQRWNKTLALREIRHIWLMSAILKLTQFKIKMPYEALAWEVYQMTLKSVA